MILEAGAVARRRVRRRPAAAERRRVWRGRPRLLPGRQQRLA